jgi:hypothetical protein
MCRSSASFHLLEIWWKVAGSWMVQMNDGESLTALNLPITSLLALMFHILVAGRRIVMK